MGEERAMADRERTADWDRSTRREWLARTGGLAAGAGWPRWAPAVAAPGVGAGRSPSAAAPAGRHRGQAGEHGPGLRPALLVAPGLPERLQQARLRGRERASSSPASRSRGSRTATRPGSSTWWTTPSSTTASRSPSKDVAFTFNRLLDAKNKLPMRVFFTPVEGVEAVGPHQVRFHLSRPFGPLLAMLSQATEIVNEKALAREGPEALPRSAPGPIKFVEWVKDDHITLERWDKYFRPGRPYLDRIIFYAPADDTVRLTGLQTGRFNWIQTVPPQRIARAGAAPRDMKSSPGRPVLPVLPHAEREPAAAQRQAAAPGHRVGDRPLRDREAGLLRHPRGHRRAHPEPSPWATGVNAHKGGARPRPGQAAPARTPASRRAGSP